MKDVILQILFRLEVIILILYVIMSWQSHLERKRIKRIVKQVMIKIEYRRLEFQVSEAINQSVKKEILTNILNKRDKNRECTYEEFLQHKRKDRDMEHKRFSKEMQAKADARNKQNE